ncbi:MAG: OB-fold nucleic acid binding domain-containing protein [Nanoarchaeota archaeon]|nr:OB-fold nucleic acid binding domain-containing protein [Nanoarchaeota archaeon]
MPEIQQKTFQKRQIAYGVSISNILSGSFTKDELSIGYMRLGDINVSRVNVIATLVHKPEQSSSYYNAIVDDGTGRISLRSFDNNYAFSKVEIGDIVLIIGKIREFNGEIYIVPEILKKINNIGWVNVRKLELIHNKMIAGDIKIEENKDKGLIEQENTSINEEIYSLIKKLDDGYGVSIEDIIKNSSNSRAENIITKLLENGDIFEIKPGKLKVLE